MSNEYHSHGQEPSFHGQAPAANLQPGQQADRFELVRMLGHGGMGQAWLAIDPRRKDEKREGHVVLKFLPDALRHHPDATQDFRAAYRRVQALHHESICPLFDLGESRELGCFQVMQFIPGITLRELMRSSDPDRTGLELGRVIRYLQPIARALDYAHQKKIIHRDIKPDNVIVDPETKEVHVIDFGLAAELRTSMSRYSQQRLSVSGTESYMPHEQWLGQPQDGRSDQYSLAVVAWELLTGQLPFQGSGKQLAYAVEQAPVPALPEHLQQLQSVFERAFSKERDQRFESVEAFVKSLSDNQIIEARGRDQIEEIVDIKSHRDDFAQQLENSSREPTNPKQPAMLIAPFDAKAAKAGQQAWAAHLGLDVEISNSIGMKFRLIPPGEFLMGSPESESNRGEDEVQHEVKLTKPYYVGTTKVTQGQWKAVMGTTPWSGNRWVNEGNDYPATYLCWEDTHEFINKLNESEGDGYRLPTEAEWEFACRAGSDTAYCFGDDATNLTEYCWFYENVNSYYDEYACQVAEKKPNQFGLYDMHGNVCEWCKDWYGDYPSAAVTDPMGPASGSKRVYRGSAWLSGSELCRSARRNRDIPDLQGSVCACILGFRVLRSYVK
ncbi:SUMF1/EgtB/PvdO family nonheme iron enzyme [Gimesia sp.]|uniref:SUMF1/EgtB/PvdO family nonheme iron enzyme n=1 Tax=Gimesia sp. TaxID=2024833 RepID=UPI003A959971